VLTRPVTLLVTLVLALALASCGGDDAAEPEPSPTAPAAGTEDGGEAPSFELRVGGVLPLTGDLASFGPSIAEGLRIGVDRIQQAIDEAGLEDVQITLVGIEDGETRAPAGVEAATKLVETDRVHVLIGEMASSVTIPIAQSVTIPNGIVQITPTSTAPDITDLEDDGFLFRILSSDVFQGRALAQAAIEAFGEDATVNVGARNDAFGRALQDLFVEEFESRGGTIGRSVTWNPEAAAFDSEAQELAGGEPDGWVIIDFPDTFARFAPPLVRAGGWDPARTFMTEAMRNADELREIGEQATEGIRGTAPTSEVAPARQPFDELFRAEASENTPLTGFEGSSFDAVMLAFLAALEARSSEPEQIRDHLQSVSGPPGRKVTFEELDVAVEELLAGNEIDYEGAWGPIDFDDNGDPGSAIYEVWRFAGGEVETERTFTFEGD
jgi:ABC-type branched-subunit amino acid transport system substrate-binding protein